MYLLIWFTIHFSTFFLKIEFISLNNYWNEVSSNFDNVYLGNNLWIRHVWLKATDNFDKFIQLFLDFQMSCSILDLCDNLFSLVQSHLVNRNSYVTLLGRWNTIMSCEASFLTFVLLLGLHPTSLQNVWSMIAQAKK